jgi:hypothetical protein
LYVALAIGQICSLAKAPIVGACGKNCQLTAYCDSTGVREHTVDSDLPKAFLDRLRPRVLFARKLFINQESVMRFSGGYSRFVIEATRHARRAGWIVTGSVALALIGHSVRILTVARGDGGAKPQHSEGPSAESLAQQIAFFAGRIQESLASETEYDIAKQTRVRKDAMTLAALARCMKQHGGEHVLVAAADEIATTADGMMVDRKDFSKTNSHWKSIEAALKRDAKSPETPASPAARQNPDALADIDTLMKQIRFVENRLKLSASKLDEQPSREQVAGFAATYAALAKPLADLAPKYGKEAEEWSAMSRALERSAIAASRAANGNDAPAMKSALRRVEQSCNACHAAFRR